MLFHGLRVLPVLLLASCASILSKSTYPVTFDTNPSGANIVINDQDGKAVFAGVAPTTLSLSASAGFFSGARYKLVASLPGYQSASGELVAGLDGWYIGNIILGGLIGLLIVDPLTGAMFKLDDRIVLDLPPTIADPALLP